MATDVKYGLRSLETEAPLAAVPILFTLFVLKPEREKSFEIPFRRYGVWRDTDGIR